MACVYRAIVEVEMDAADLLELSVEEMTELSKTVAFDLAASDLLHNVLYNAVMTRVSLQKATVKVTDRRER